MLTRYSSLLHHAGATTTQENLSGVTVRTSLSAFCTYILLPELEHFVCRDTQSYKGA